MKNHLSFRDYKCVWCGEAIPAGSAVIRHLSLWETDGQDWRLHPECRDACKREGSEDFTLFDNPRGQTTAELPLPPVPRRSRRPSEEARRS